MDTAELERALIEAKVRVTLATKALAPRHVGNEVAEFQMAHAALLGAERALALARGEECATPCAGFPDWDTGAPLPHLLYGSHGVVLAYFTNVPDPDWDGTNARVVDVADEAVELVAVIRFKRVSCVRIGTPNDEVLHGHPLHGKGLEGYGAHTVVNSRWLADLQRINSVHAQHDASRWAQSHHYLLAFHDETFECIAEGFVAEVKRTTLAQACRDALAEVLGT